MANTLVDAVGELTPHIERIPLAEGRTAIRAELRPNAAMKVLCSGHYDTVFEADHPFQAPRVLEDPPRLNGSGVADMKGGLVVMLATLAAFEKSPHAAEIGWTILLTPDEEIGSIYSAAVIAAEAPRHQLGLVFEPARESGAMVRSRAATSIFKIEVHGREAHAGRNPEDGRNAVTALARLCLEIDALPPTISNTLVNVGNFTGGGTVNIVPEFAQAEINARASTQEGVDALTTATASVHSFPAGLPALHSNSRPPAKRFLPTSTNAPSTSDNRPSSGSMYPGDPTAMCSMRPGSPCWTVSARSAADSTPPANTSS
jgi:glutamate carboxypeptidase